MKLLCYSLLSAGLVACLSNCGSSSGNQVDYTPVDSVGVTSKSKGLEGSIHSKVNSYRTSIGRKKLQRHAELDKLARQHSQFMLRNAGKFKLEGKRITHSGFSGRSLKARLGLDMQSISENVGASPPRADAAGSLVAAWIKSRGHHFNLKARYKYTGVGVTVGPDGYVYATQLFANPFIGRRWENGRPLF